MFAYARPESLAETFELLRDAPQARVLCGGTDLIVGLRKGKFHAPLVIDIKRVAELESGIERRASSVRIGATAVLTSLIEDDLIGHDFPALVEAASVVGSIQIRNRATLAGNICNASPAADTVPPLLVYGAVVELTSSAGTRRVSLDEFLTGPGRTVLGSGEIVSAIELPLPTERRGSSFGRMTRRRGVDLATVNLACTVSASGITTFAYGAVGPRAFLVSDETGDLADPRSAAGEREAIIARLTSQASPISNVRASREYREAMLLVLSRRALDRALANLAGGAA